MVVLLGLANVRLHAQATAGVEATVVISELSASNRGVILDQDGDSPDWIELFNPTDKTIPLEGWFLTDDALDLRQWRIPDITLASGEYVLVFASGKDRAVPGQELHTNFKLEKNGEYLGLIQPDGLTVASEFAPAFPALAEDVSYGLGYTWSETNQAMEPTAHRGFLSEASPGGPNTGVLRYTVHFSQPTGIYETGFQVALHVVEAPELEIRYTLDGTAPSAQNGLVYRDPIPVAGNTGIRAGAVIEGQISTLSEAHYLLTDASIQSFSSDLPLVIAYSFGVEPTSTRDFVPVALSILEPEEHGRTRMSSPQNYHGCADLHLRGNNSAAGSTPKKQMKLSLCTANNENRNAELLGMPADEDWILINPGNHDRSRLNNPIMFELGRACGEPWVSRYRFVEVFINTDDGDRSRLDYASDYRGIYILAERIKVHEDRVNITKMSPGEVNEPAVTGGYIFKMDERCDSDEICFTSPMIQATFDGEPRTSRRIVFDTPDQEKLTPEQYEWMTRYLLRLESVLKSNNVRDPHTGYQAYIDRDSWIQMHLLHSAVNNVETSRKSIYYYKDRLGRLKGGPLWDFDWGMNKYGTSGWPFAYKDNWWGPLFEDPDFQILWEDRWFELREQQLSDAAMVTLIDDLGSEIREAWFRDAARWPSYAQDYEQEMSRLKTWFQQRFAWIDRQFEKPPAFQWQPAAGDGGGVLTMSHPDGYAIRYTLDGSDPRAPGGSRQPHAIPYTAPIRLPEFPVRVRARAEYLQSRYTLLTAQRQAVYWTDPIPLQVTEVQYDAPEGNAHEYLVLTNLGQADLSLRDYTLRGDIDYDFNTSQTEMLASGASVVVVKDLDAFQGHGDAGLYVAGEYSGNLDDQGGCVDLIFHGETLQTFCY
jgi:hypothetical protein